MADIGALTRVDDLYAEAERQFADWDVVKDVVDEMIDLSLNYRQSGHPGGSRSKVHLFLSLLLSGAMRWDIRRPWRPFADRFVLSAGHTVPLVYATLAVLNETLRARHEWTGDARFAFPDEGRWALTWEDLPTLRHRGGLPGHAEMAGKTLFLKFNTGPSGHGMPPAAGEALALKLAGCEDVRVFADHGWRGALADDRLLNGLNVCRGSVTCQAVAEAHGMAYVPGWQLAWPVTKATWRVVPS